MPSIEIVSIGCAAVPPLPDFAHFDYEAESEVHSHRGLGGVHGTRTSYATASPTETAAR